METVEARTVRVADVRDADDLLRVTNAAYQVEKFFVDHERLDPEKLAVLLAKGVFLIMEDRAGCVYVELRGDRAYFGPLSVDPARQGSGLGKLLVKAAEDYARAHGCRHMDMRIVNLREELPAFYDKLGYKEMGTELFPETEPTLLPCHLIRMSKAL